MGGWLSLQKRVADISRSVHTPQLRRALPRPSDTHNAARRLGRGFIRGQGTLRTLA